MNYGDLGKRLVAYLIDSVILAVIYSIIWVVIYWYFYLGIAALIISPFIPLAYFTIMEGSGWHATLGKRAMGLYVADEHGNGITYSKAILRSLGKILSSMILGIGYIIGLFSEEKQCLHDMIAKTYVLNGKAADGGGPRLICVNGPLAGMIYAVPNGGLIIGRDSISCQVILPSSQKNVSRVHCLLTYNPMSKMFVLSDHNSTLGTFLDNGTRVMYSNPAALRSGDRFYLASRENLFEVR